MALLKFKRSAVPAKVPSIADLDLGELAINTYDGKVYTKKDDGTQAIVEVGGGSGVTSFNTRTGAVTLSGSDVTTALGYTPYDAANPAGYITGINSGNVTTALGYTPANRAGDTFTGPITVNSGANQVILGSDGAIELTRGAGGAYFDFKNSTAEDFDVRLQASGSQLNISAAGGLTLNGAGVLTGITSGQVTTALGYTPANKAGDTFTGDISVPITKSFNCYTVNYGMGTPDSSGLQIYAAAGDTMRFGHRTGGVFTERFIMGTGGNVTANVDFRAPIFYDSNDTAYYINGAGDSVLNTLYFRNGSIQAKFAQASNFGYSSSYKTIVLGNEYLTTISMGVDVSGNASGSFNGQGEGREVLFRNGVSFITPNAANTNYLNVMQMTDGVANFTAYATAAGSFRAPLFYDSNDTSYFVDPNSTSRLSVANVNFLTLFNDEGLNVKGIRGQFAAGSDGQGISLFSNVDIGYPSGWGSGLGNTPSRGLSIYGGLRVAYSGGGFITSDTSVRAPIFYDSNDTSYYVDANSTSVLNGINVWGEIGARRNDVQSILRSYNLSAGSPLQFYLDHNYGNVNIGNSRGVVFAGGSYWEIANSVRAPIFYDSNNTGYYIDPASTSLTNIMAVGQGLAVFDLNTVASDPYGLVGITRRTDNNYSYLGFTRAGQHAMGMGIDTGNTFWIGGLSGAGYNSVRASSWLLMHTSGYVTAPVDMRSPLFYDNNNTAFYLDPNGRSNLSNITVASGGTESGIRFRGDTLDFVGRYSNYVSLYNANGPEFKLFDSGYAYLGHYAENGASWRAPIFYDTNDTGRYVDPNSTSNLYRLSSYIAAQDVNSNWNTGFQNTPASSYNYHGDLNGGTNAPAAGWWFYESMRHSNASNFWGTQIAWGWEDNANRMLQRNVTGNSFGGWVEYLNTSGRTYNGNLNMTGSIISTASDVRAPIFYDQNDTSTFINPNGESWIKGDFKLSRVAAGGDNDCFGGLELREVSLVGAAQSAATYAPRVNFHWGARAAATIYMDAGGSFVFGGQGNITSNRRSIFCNELYATGNVTAYYSDDRLKTRIGNIENALDIVSSLNGFRYVDNELAETFGYANNGAQLGVSAQEVQKHLPEIVRGAAFDVDHDDPDHGSKTGEHYLTVDYSRLVPLLIEAIKELRDEVEALKK